MLYIIHYLLYVILLVFEFAETFNELCVLLCDVLEVISDVAGLEFNEPIELSAVNISVLSDVDSAKFCVEPLSTFSVFPSSEVLDAKSDVGSSSIK
ncbi:MAG: hypothetical protein MR364_00255 [Oscillospiraceae bacterium]|nr:hypothetical protein [Oscillospiraceae bacterium]